MLFNYTNTDMRLDHLLSTSFHVCNFLHILPSKVYFMHTITELILFGHLLRNNILMQIVISF